MLQGPVAPVLDDLGDALAWHEPASAMAPNGMRRIRRIDVARGAGADAPLAVDAMFRDTHMDVGGAVTIVHEYQLAAEVDPTAFTITSIDAPAASCRTGNARRPRQRAARRRHHDGRAPGARTRAEFVGASTCTHLNDVLRALEDVEAFASTLDREDAR